MICSLAKFGLEFKRMFQEPLPVYFESFTLLTREHSESTNPRQGQNLTGVGVFHFMGDSFSRWGVVHGGGNWDTVVGAVAANISFTEIVFHRGTYCLLI